MTNEEIELSNGAGALAENESPEIEVVPRKNPVKKVARATYRGLQHASGILALVGLIVAASALYLTWGPASYFKSTDPATDGFVQPRSIYSLVTTIQDSTVTVWCETDEYSGQGTAWAIDFETDVQDKYPTTLVTNHHVIKRCLNNAGKVTVALPYEDPKPAVIVDWDKENDLAVLATKVKLPPLNLSYSEPYQGYWVMALGSADGYEGSVSFGNVLNTTDTDILITNSVSHGNSGGPLVDNEGNVIGVISWSYGEEQYNGAKSLDAFCVKIFTCDYDKGTSWWDYHD